MRRCSRTIGIARGGVLAVAIALQGCVYISGNNLNPFSSEPQQLEEHVVSGEGEAKILLLDISNMITNLDQSGPFGIGEKKGLSTRVREQLDKAAEDEDVKALLLRINSPGGTVTASDMIYHDITELKTKRGIPVVAQMLDMGTSGAYYIALAADEIIASPTTVTGSIGVILSGANFSGLMEKIGVKDQTLKTGTHKDAGSPLRPMTESDNQLLQGVLTDLQSRFLATVRERRPQMSAEALKTMSDGRIVTATQALELGVVDRIGYLDDTIKAVEKRATVGSAQVVIYRRPSEFAETIYAHAPIAPAQMNLINFDLHILFGVTHQFLYMWAPTP